jgi:hypothetical protein
VSAGTFYAFASTRFPPTSARSGWLDGRPLLDPFETFALPELLLSSLLPPKGFQRGGYEDQTKQQLEHLGRG